MKATKRQIERLEKAYQTLGELFRNEDLYESNRGLIRLRVEIAIDKLLDFVNEVDHEKKNPCDYEFGTVEHLQSL